MKKLLSATALAAGALFAAAPASAAIVFSFTPSATQIAVGDSVTIEARISGLADEILSAFDLLFTYDASVLDWQIITAVNELGINGGLATNGLPNGSLGFNDFSLEDDDDLAAVQGDDLLLFTFQLDGVTDGATVFTLGPDPDFDRNFVGRRAQSLLVDVGSVCIAVGQGSCDVPEPESFGLAAIALLGAGFAGRTRRRKGQAA